MRLHSLAIEMHVNPIPGFALAALALWFLGPFGLVQGTPVHPRAFVLREDVDVKVARWPKRAMGKDNREVMAVPYCFDFPNRAEFLAAEKTAEEWVSKAVKIWNDPPSLKNAKDLSEANPEYNPPFNFRPLDDCAASLAYNGVKIFPLRITIGDGDEVMTTLGYKEDKREMVVGRKLLDGTGDKGNTKSNEGIGRMLHELGRAIGLENMNTVAEFMTPDCTKL